MSKSSGSRMGIATSLQSTCGGLWRSGGARKSTAGQVAEQVILNHACYWVFWVVIPNTLPIWMTIFLSRDVRCGDIRAARALSSRSSSGLGST